MVIYTFFLCVQAPRRTAASALLDPRCACVTRYNRSPLDNHPDPDRTTTRPASPADKDVPEQGQGEGEGEALGVHIADHKPGQYLLLTLVFLHVLSDAYPVPSLHPLPAPQGRHTR